MNDYRLYGGLTPAGGQSSCCLDWRHGGRSQQPCRQVGGVHKTPPGKKYRTKTSDLSLKLSYHCASWWRSSCSGVTQGRIRDGRRRWGRLTPDQLIQNIVKIIFRVYLWQTKELALFFFFMLSHYRKHQHYMNAALTLSKQVSQCCVWLLVGCRSHS